MRRNIVLAVFALIVLLPILALALNKPEGSDIKGKVVGNSLEQIAIIHVDGPIVGGRGGGGLFEEGLAGSEVLMERIREAKEDPNVKGVILRINSPGGSAAASQEIGDELDALRESGKPIVVSMADMAASGGYWLAAKGDKIVANPATITGSIGVIMQMANMEELYEKIGIEPLTIKSGPHKDMGATNRSLTESEEEILQSMVNDIYEQFVEVVVTGRKMDEAKAREVADGRIFTGRQALELGLVDELGNFYRAQEIAKELTGLENPEFVEMTQKSPFSELFHIPGSQSLSFQQIFQSLLLWQGNLESQSTGFTNIK